MATHSSIHPWRIPWTEKPGRLHSLVRGDVKVGHNLATETPPTTAITEKRLTLKNDTKLERSFILSNIVDQDWLVDAGRERKSRHLSKTTYNFSITRRSKIFQHVRWGKAVILRKENEQFGRGSQRIRSLKTISAVRLLRSVPFWNSLATKSPLQING